MRVEVLTVKLFYTNVPEEAVNLVRKALEGTYPIQVEVAGDKPLPAEAYHPEREQYNAEILLEQLLKEGEIRFWVIQEDIYCPGMNFIFGLASIYKGAVLSLNRLTSSELIRKEAIHEMGHILGLNHCSNNCVMQYSNSLWEAKWKPSTLCDECKKKIELFIKGK
ncbi:MAG TPA: peptidase [Thermoplasmatales archaeon]|nr:peptidase [Thermoplasmatales archaeon]